MDEPLQVREVHPILTKQRRTIRLVSSTDRLKEAGSAGKELVRLDKFLGDLVEVSSGAFYGCPARAPSLKVKVILGWANDFVEVLKKEQEQRPLLRSHCPCEICGTRTTAARRGRDRFSVL